ncbi:MAG: right-handed parallel beta-helix repeat-containing protein [Kiritimatiellae bacterium]|nr:right-handed parallel beta-helix repeat-containing protein [Kiritimatiellia bacterium]
MNRSCVIRMCMAFSVVGATALPAFGAEMEPPPGPPGSDEAAMRSLNEIEPRVPIMDLPHVITNSGAYYLLRPLQGTTGITIETDDVVLDLGGFSLQGLTNSGNGLSIVSSVQGVIIRNGAIDGWNGYGISGADAGHVQVLNVSLILNSLGGMRLGDYCTVQECTATENGGHGIELGESCTVKDCKTSANGGCGIVVGFGSQVIGSSAMRNTEQGIRAEIYSTIRDCSVVHNTGHGIQVNASCRVESNNIGDNGKDEGSAGILVPGPGNRIKDNNITANYYGIDVAEEGVGNWIEGNNVIDNNVGIRVLGTGNFIIRNGVGTPLETNSPVHFAIGETNQYGEILENMGGAFTNSNPWANIRLTEEQSGE